MERMYTAEEMKQAYREGGYSYGEWITYNPDKPSPDQWMERYDKRFPASEDLTNWQSSINLPT